MKEWTIMVYMAGDNNLSDDMITAINALRNGLKPPKPDAKGAAIPPTSKISVLAQFDCAHPTVPTRRYNFQIQDEEKQVSILPPKDDLVPTSKAIFNFVKWCIKQEPAQRYALILSGHGDGFQGRTFLMDDDPFSMITVPKLRKTLEKVKIWLLNGKKLDMIGIDSCLMSTIEVVYELKDVAKVWVSSQGTIPNSGWEYERTIKRLINNPQLEPLEPEEFGRIIIEEFQNFNHKYAFGGRSVDLSVGKLNKIEKVGQEIDKLGKVLKIYFDDDEPAFKQIDDLVKEKVEKNILLSHWKCQTYMTEQCVDLSDFCLCLQEECEIVKQEVEDIFKPAKKTDLANEIMKAMNKIIAQCKLVQKAIKDYIVEGKISGADFQFSKGVSLFFPWSYLSYIMTLRKYRDFKFYSEVSKPNWDNFIYKFLIKTIRKPIDNNLDKIGFIGLLSRNDPPRSKGLGEYLSYFSRTKNYPLNWEAKGGFER